MKKAAVTASALAATALGVRLIRSRHRRFLHPDVRSFAGELAVWGIAPIGSVLTDHPGRHPVTLRLSKGMGTRPGWADVLGVALRVHGPAPEIRCDLLFSTAGQGRLSRHIPMPRESFDTMYGAIVAYRTGTGRKVYLSAEADPDGPSLGRTLEAVVTAAAHNGARLTLKADGRPFGQITFGAPLSPAEDAALAFDPIRNAPADLRPTGALHGSRAVAYRLSQAWRRAG